MNEGDSSLSNTNSSMYDMKKKFVINYDKKKSNLLFLDPKKIRHEERIGDLFRMLFQRFKNR